MANEYRVSSDLNAALAAITRSVFTHGKPVPVEKWHGIETAGKPDLQSIELLNVHFSASMPTDHNVAKELCEPNLPWAEDHFQERVGGEPLNPGDQWKNWPYYPQQGKMYDQEFRSGGEFTHTYMERMWPKYAGSNERGRGAHGMRGLRFTYGDLEDVKNLLLNYPHTRQAYLPIWFPEDTGAVHGGRVPCTLGYHFMQRDKKLHLWYTIRSCDVIRYLRDDVYMAIRLAQWMLEGLSYRSDFWGECDLGALHFHAFSLHAFEGDRYVGKFAEGSEVSRPGE